jgi:hypothetical protein
MKERPILFSAPMVRALLAGTKTQTRRAWPEQPPPGVQVAWVPGETSAGRYGKPGDRLWVREAFSGPHCMEKTDELPAMPPGQWPQESAIWYWADGNPDYGDWTRPRPSIHMPRWASRITLEVTEVRVERLQDISEADAIAEGIERGQDFPGWYRGPLPGDSAGLEQAGRDFKIPTAFPKLAYRALWESINGNRPKLPNNIGSRRYPRIKKWLDAHPDTTSWDANPWVWVVSFRRLP